ncbi:MAG: 5'-nucleotidase C-terminal domain-containing protein [Pseudomonadota bacterium]
MRILATSDVHMHLTGWDPLHERRVAGRGIDVLARTIHRARQSAPDAYVLLDNGDVLQGTPVAAQCASPPEDTPHPWAEIVNALAYDAVGLGNHDFDFGVPFLEGCAAHMECPVVCGSLSSGQIRGVLPSTQITRTLRCSDGQHRQLRIGIASVLPPQTAVWNSRYLHGLMAFDTGVVAARRSVTHLREQGADVIIMLCHSGIGVVPTDDGENFAAQIAQEVEGIDAMVCGHTHQTFPARDGPHTLNGVPFVMPGFAAEVLGQIDLRLGWTDGVWHVAGHDARLVTPRADDEPDPVITAIAAPALERTRKALDQILAQTDTGFHTYFGMLQPSQSDTLVARAMMDVLAQQVAGSDLEHLPLIAAVAPMSMGGRAGPGNFVNVPAGSMQARHIAMLSPYTNAVWGMVLKGSDLMRWAERAAGYFSPTLDDGLLLVNTDVPSFNFDMLYGLEATIDPTRPPMYDSIGQLANPAARRVRSLSHRAAPIDCDAAFLVAMTSYRGAGGGKFPGLDNACDVLRTEHDLTDALHRLVRRGPMAVNDMPTAWRFAARHGMQVVIETSPNAEYHLDEIADFAPSIIGLNDAGFLEVGVTI